MEFLCEKTMGYFCKGGSKFQTVGLATENAQRPSVLRRKSVVEYSSTFLLVQKA